MARRGGIVESVALTPKVTYRKFQYEIYTCETCGTDYRSEAEARTCADMGTEEPPFRVGDKVTWREPAVCNHKGGRTPFRIKGTVTKILPPEPIDEEYNLKWLQGAYRNIHTKALEVEFSCLCRKRRSMRIYCVETEPLRILRRKPRKK